MHDFYWRVEVDGLEQIPNQGRGVLVGVHRGFMPWDAVMFLHELVTRKNRFPRFLIHPGLIKYPFLFNFHTKLGGVVACRENADYMLENDKLLGIFPEGMRGAFTLYKDAHRLGKFGRNDFVKIALRNRAPMIPFRHARQCGDFPDSGKNKLGLVETSNRMGFFSDHSDISIFAARSLAVKMAHADFTGDSYRRNV